MFKRVFLILVMLIFFILPLSAKRVAVVVGVSDPGTGVSPLVGVNTDVTNMKNLLQNYGFKVIELVDKNATVPIVKKYLMYQQELNENDVFVFYFSGYGGRIKDINGDEKDGLDEVIVLDSMDREKKFIKNYLFDDEIDYYLRKIKAKKILFFDTCYGGTVTKSIQKSKSIQLKNLGLIKISKDKLTQKGSSIVKEKLGANEKNIKSKYTDSEIKGVDNLLLFNASKDNDEVSIATSSGSVFTTAIIEGLKNRNADLNADQRVTSNELIKFCRVYVKEYIEDNGLSKNFTSTPKLYGDINYTKDLITILKGENPLLIDSSFESAMNKMLDDGTATFIEGMGMDRYVYQDGDDIDFCFNSGKLGGYLTVLYVDRENVKILFPNRLSKKEKKVKGIMKFPSEVNKEIKISAQKPFGKVTLYAIISKTPLNLHEEDSKIENGDVYKTLPLEKAKKVIIPMVREMATNSRDSNELQLMMGKLIFTVEKR